MTRAVLFWFTAGNHKLAELKDKGATIVGRSPGSDVLLDDPTVSRRQAIVSEEEERYVLENVSQTNVAKVNGIPVEGRVPLTDKDQLDFGSAQLTFHDLRAGDRLSGPMCSHCSRENMPDDNDCWYCGTSLVNALTSILSTNKVSFRIVSASGEAFDVHAGEIFVVTPAGRGEVVRDEPLPSSPTVAVRPDRDKHAVLLALGGSLTLNGGVPDGDTVLSTGDVLETDSQKLVLIVR